MSNMKKRWVKLKIFKKYLPTTQKDALKKKAKTTTIIFIFLLRILRRNDISKNIEQKINI